MAMLVNQAADAEHSESLKRMVVEMRTSMKVAISAYNAIKDQEDLIDCLTSAPIRKQDRSKMLARNTFVHKNAEVMDILPL